MAVRAAKGVVRAEVAWWLAATAATAQGQIPSARSWSQEDRSSTAATLRQTSSFKLEDREVQSKYVVYEQDQGREHCCMFVVVSVGEKTASGTGNQRSQDSEDDKQIICDVYYGE